MARTVIIVFCILALCFIDQQLMAQINVKEILLNTDHILVERDTKYISSTPYSVEIGVDTAIVKVRFSANSKVINNNDTIRYSYYSSAPWNDNRGNRKSICLLMNPAKQIVDSLFFLSDIVNYPDIQNPNYSTYISQGITLLNIPYTLSPTRDTVYFRLSDSNLKGGILNVFENVEDRTRFTQSFQTTKYAIDCPDTAYISLILIGSFPLDVRQTVLHYDVRIDMQAKLITIPYTFYSDKIFCYNILGKEYRLTEVGGYGLEKHFSFAQLPEGMYFLKISNKTYKLLRSK